ncbi:MAG: DUF58 domain-containing protein [Ruminococcus sp.]|nr:DUF58 domain-containing protein [Ruminococcus sp.]
MLLTKILFIVLIIVCFFFYILYLGDFALVLFIIMLTLPVIMFAITYYTKRKIKVEFAVKDKVVAKGQSFPVQLVVTNPGIFPIGKAEAYIEYYNVFNNQITSFELYLPIQSRNFQRVTFQISSKFCGIIKIKNSQLVIFDPLRIFKFRTARNIQTEVAVVPEGQDIDGTINYTDRVNDESDNFSEHKPGDDPSEAFDLREYIPGDKLNRIHWKLSSKKDEFIVKEYSLPVDVPCVLFLNLKCYDDNDYTLPVFDTLVESLLSVSQFLIANERFHKVVYFDSRHKEFVERNIENVEMLSDMIKELIISISDNLYCESPESYFSDHNIGSLSSFTFITSVPDTDILEHIDDEVDSELKNSIVVVKDSDDAMKIQSDYSGMNIIPVVIGRISASIKDIEL